MNFLIKYGIDENSKTDIHQLIDKIGKEDSDAVEAVEFMIKSGASVDKLDEYGATPLHACARKNYVQLAKVLIKAGAKLNCKYTVLGWTAFSIAIEKNNLEFVELLLSSGVNVNETTAGGCTALHTACYRKLDASISLLLQYGADVSAKNDKDRTPFSYIEPMDSYKKLVAIMVKEFAKIYFASTYNKKSLNQDISYTSVSKADIKAINANKNAKTMFKQYLSELELMLNTTFYKQYSYYFIFKMSKTIKKLANLTKNKDFRDQFKKNVENFLFFKADVQRIFDKAVEVKDELVVVESRLRTIFGKYLPDLIIKKLTNYLTIKDLTLN